jgi:hypothetical protein
MAEPSVELKQKIDEADISKDVDVAPDITQAIDVAPGIAQPNVVEPGIDQPNVSVNTAKYFFNAEKYKVRNDLIDWCKREAAKAGFTIVIEKSDNGADRRKSISYWVAKDAVCTKNRKES